MNLTRSLLLFMKYVALCLSMCLLFLNGCAATAPHGKIKQEVATPSKVKKEASLPSTGKIQKLEVLDLKNAYRVKITATKPPTYAVFKQTKPNRITIDLPEMVMEEKGLLKEQVKNELISGIKSVPMEKNGKPSVRLEIALKQDTTYDTTQQEKNLFIDILKPYKSLSKKSPESSRSLPQSQQKQPQPSEKAPAVSAVKASLQKNTIINLNVSDTAMGHRITISAESAITKYDSFTLKKPNRLVVDFPSATSTLHNPLLNVKSSLVDKVKVGSPQKDTVRCVIYFIGTDFPLYQVAQKGGEVTVEINKYAPPRAKPAPASEKPIKQAEVSKPIGKMQEPEKEAAPIQEVQSPTAPGKKPEYTGQKISLDFKDADIKNLLRLIADVSGLNIITGDDVQGKVTLKIENIPWDEALDIILETNNLGKIVSKDVVRIETQKKITEINSKKLEEKQSQQQLEDLVSENIDVSYAKATEMVNFIKKLDILTKGRGSITSFEHTNRVTIQDIPAKVKRMKKLVQEQDVPTRQVLIEARIVQSNPSYAKELGVKWGGFYNTVRNGGAAKGGADISTSGAAGGGNVVNLPAPVGIGSGGGINFGYITNSLQLDVQLTALENQEKIKIVSSPKILGLDNKEARIKQGVALPFLKLSEQGVTSTEFKDAVLELKVTPKITPANTINLHVFVTKNQKSAQTGAGGEPGIDIREVETDLLVESGKTIVIGGIYENTKANSVKKVPFFGDLPYIGRFFRNERIEDQLIEILVFLTVTVVSEPTFKTQPDDTSQNSAG